ncbi:uncharacterized protein LOC142331324 [Lycorma delicatula]|uniref:uncharacterized protein LOC142331324 n=1 Tax=Lycorma delicatula TaxID=130591 RepID=UPI003F51AB41
MADNCDGVEEKESKTELKDEVVTSNNRNSHKEEGKSSNCSSNCDNNGSHCDGFIKNKNNDFCENIIDSVGSIDVSDNLLLKRIISLNQTDTANSINNSDDYTAQDINDDCFESGMLKVVDDYNCTDDSNGVTSALEEDIEKVEVDVTGLNSTKENSISNVTVHTPYEKNNNKTSRKLITSTPCRQNDGKDTYIPPARSILKKWRPSYLIQSIADDNIEDISAIESNDNAENPSNSTALNVSVSINNKKNTLNLLDEKNDEFEEAFNNLYSTLFGNEIDIHESHKIIDAKNLMTNLNNNVVKLEMYHTSIVKQNEKNDEKFNEIISEISSLMSISNKNFITIDQISENNEHHDLSVIKEMSHEDDNDKTITNQNDNNETLIKQSDNAEEEVKFNISTENCSILTNNIDSNENNNKIDKNSNDIKEKKTILMSGIKIENKTNDIKENKAKLTDRIKIENKSNDDKENKAKLMDGIKIENKSIDIKENKFKLRDKIKIEISEDDDEDVLLSDTEVLQVPVINGANSIVYLNNKELTLDEEEALLNDDDADVLSIICSDITPRTDVSNSTKSECSSERENLKINDLVGSSSSVPKCDSATVYMSSSSSSNLNDIPVIKPDPDKKPAADDKNAPFVSSDPQENEDNNNPDWEHLRRLKNDKQRYKALRDRWRSVVIPDPNLDLSTQTYRRNRIARETKALFEQKPKSWAEIKQPGSVNVNNENICNTRKRLRSPRAQNENIGEPATKRMKCTVLYEENIKEVLRKLEFKRYCLYQEMNQQLSELALIQERQFNDAVIRHNYKMNNQQFNELHQLQTREVCDLRKIYRQRINDEEHQAKNYICAMEAAAEEVHTFHKFYHELDSNFDNINSLYLNDGQVRELIEIELMLENYQRFYNQIE